MLDCPFCPPQLRVAEIRFENEHCLFLAREEPVLIGSGMIVPRLHRRTVFDLTQTEWNATFELLAVVKQSMEESLTPDGYNVGWNCEPIGGQTVFHAHLHVIPRFADEPLAGRGIRYWLKQESNRRK